MKHALAALALALYPLPNLAAGEGTSRSAHLCVINDDTEPRFFVLAPRGAERSSGWLAPGAQLCAPGGGLIQVFASEDAVEGCSLSRPDGAEERLRAYADFDNCRWGFHAP